jgi:hypothetical protein
MTMNNVTFVEVETMFGNETHAVIDHGNGEFTSMLKSTYDAQQAELKPAKAAKVVNAPVSE